ncbi:MAG TPA: hypothetical protein VNG71_08225 [Pyrinomonadaceae bacterium]|nr:hypothetical protein [Pyrinomonadaceae bacterium]
MKILGRLLILISVATFASVVSHAQDRAILRRDSATNFRAEVTLNTEAVAGSKVVAALYQVDTRGARKQIQKLQGILPAQPAAGQTVFSLDFPTAPSDDDSFVVDVFELATANGILSFDLPVTKLLDVSMRTGRQKCSRGIQLTLRSSDYALQDWKKVEDWAHRTGNKPGDTGTVEIRNPNSTFVWSFDSAESLTPFERAKETGAMIVCLKLEPTLPDKPFSATIKLTEAPTYDLTQPLVGKGLDPAAAPPLPTLADDNGVPGKRGLERNLDIGVTFSSAVELKDRTNPTTKAAEKFKDRTSRGVLDLRLAPWLYLGRKKEFDRNQKWYGYFNPFFLDAAISTGKIDEDTLSTNRVVLGTEYEWRFYDFKKDTATGNTQTSPYVNIHRFILRGNHASDRDFKQLEYFATFEYQPLLGALNHPLYLSWRFEDGRRVAGRFGFEIQPRFGVELGRTYARRDPAAALQTSPTIRRFYTGLDMDFNLTRFLTISVSDTFWLRGEAPSDRFHNHFKGTFEAPLGRSFRSSVHSLFLSFERGQEPPFASSDTNAFKIGYRIRSEGWGGRFR